MVTQLQRYNLCFYCIFSGFSSFGSPYFRRDHTNPHLLVQDAALDITPKRQELNKFHLTNPMKTEFELLKMHVILSAVDWKISLSNKKALENLL